MRARTLWLLSLLVTGLVVAVVVLAAPVGHHVVRRVGARPSPTAEPCATRALEVLRTWDRHRARAWSAADPTALTRLYTRRSPTVRRDVVMLAAYRARGLRVRSMHRQVLALRVRTCRAGRLSLLVTDRLVDAVAVGHGIRTGLPSGQPMTRRVELRRRAGRWRVTGVYAR